MSKFLCPDCLAELNIPSDVLENELITCASCGLELVYSNGKLTQIELDGIDYGE